MGRAAWLEGVAVIRESDRVGHEAAGQGEPWPWEIHLNRFGTNKYDFTLEVGVPGTEPYLVADRFKVPRKAENLGFFNVGNKIPASSCRSASTRATASTREQFEHQLTIEVDHGRMDPGDAEAARATLDG